MGLDQKINAAWLHRQNYIQKQKWMMFRLIDGEGDGLPGLHVDYYEGNWVITFKDPMWVTKQKAIQDTLKKIRPHGEPSSHFYEYENFGKEKKSEEKKESLVKIVSEENIKYEIHLGEGLHTGIFLDQRDNRARMKELAKGKKRFLNLFCYTGAFTLAALKGGAEEVISVDLSQNYLNWLKRNVELNQLDLKQALTFREDAFVYLKRAAKREESFDGIILDPPTFSRGKGGVFSTEKKLGELLSLTLPLLKPEGKLFVSINTHRMTPVEFEKMLYSVLIPKSFKILKTFSPPFDFRASYLKSCLVGR